MALTLSTPNTGTSTVTIPTHAVGDLIILFAYTAGSNTSPAKPTATGTVPAWVDINANAGANTNASRCVYFVATATNHTSGTWATSQIISVVLTGQAAAPIGGKAESGSTGSGSVTAPAVTMTSTDGTSVLLHFFANRNATGWSAAPTGYTRQLASGLVALNTKDSTTADGATTQTGSTSGGWRGQTVEVLAAAGGSTTTLTPSGASVTITGTAPILISDSVLTPAAATITVTGTAPKLENTVSPPGGSLTGALITITGTAPTLTMSLVTTGATITISGGTPSTAGESILSPAAATIAVTGTAPTLLVSIVPGSETLPVTGGTPALVLVTVLSPAAAAISVTGGTPLVILPITLQPSSAPITVTGSNPTITVGIFVAPTPDEDHLLLVRREHRTLSLEGSRIHTMGRFKQVVDA